MILNLTNRRHQLPISLPNVSFIKAKVSELGTSTSTASVCRGTRRLIDHWFAHSMIS